MRSPSSDLCSTPPSLEQHPESATSSGHNITPATTDSRHQIRRQQSYNPILTTTADYSSDSDEPIGMPSRSVIALPNTEADISHESSGESFPDFHSIHQNLTDININQERNLTSSTSPNPNPEITILGQYDSSPSLNTDQASEDIPIQSESESETGSSSNAEHAASPVVTLPIRLKDHKRKATTSQKAKLGKKSLLERDRRHGLKELIEELKKEIDPTGAVKTEQGMIERCISFIEERKTTNAQSKALETSYSSQLAVCKKTIPPTDNNRHAYFERKRRERMKLAYDKLILLLFPDTTSTIHKRKAYQKCLEVIRRYKRSAFTKIYVNIAEGIRYQSTSTSSNTSLSGQTSPASSPRELKKIDMPIPESSTVSSDTQQTGYEPSTETNPKTRADEFVESLSSIRSHYEEGGVQLPTSAPLKKEISNAAQPKPGTSQESAGSALSEVSRHYVCDICQVSFRRATTLKMHKRIHSGEDELYDYGSHKKKPDKTSKLGRRQQNKSEKSPKIVRRKCGVYCPSSGKNSDSCVAPRKDINLAQSTYFRKSKTIKPYKCPFCSADFPSKSILGEHKLLHGKKLYKCDLCGKGFTLKDTLKKHTLIHIGERYKCTTCSKTFSWQSTLILHQKTKCTDARETFKCGICSKIYLKESSLIKHQKKPHASVAPTHEETARDRVILRGRQAPRRDFSTNTASTLPTTIINNETCTVETLAASRIPGFWGSLWPNKNTNFPKTLHITPAYRLSMPVTGSPRSPAMAMAMAMAKLLTQTQGALPTTPFMLYIPPSAQSATYVPTNDLHDTGSNSVMNLFQIPVPAMPTSDQWINMRSPQSVLPVISIAPTFPTNRTINTSMSMTLSHLADTRANRMSTGVSIVPCQEQPRAELSAQANHEISLDLPALAMEQRHPTDQRSNDGVNILDTNDPSSLLIPLSPRQDTPE